MISGVDGLRVNESNQAVFIARLAGLTLEVNNARWHELVNPQNYDLVLSVDSVYYLTDPLSLAHFKLLKRETEIMAYYSTYEPTPATHGIMAVDEVVTAAGIVSDPCG